MLRRILKKQGRRKKSFVDPDEVFLDAKNLQNFNRQQFEGRIEKSIAKKSIFGLSIVFLVVIGVFGGRLVYLQVHKGEAYFTRSENNILQKDIIFADRGIIYDRNKKELAWNKKIDFGIPSPEADLAKNISSVRAYLAPGFSHLLGYVSYPNKDKSGKFWQEEFIGKDGIEKEYNEKLQGINGSKIVETNALGETYSENTVNTPKKGEDLVTTLDSRIQGELFNLIKALGDNGSYQGGAGVIMDVTNGELLVSTSYPEYNSEILSLGEDRTAISEYITDKRKFFLDRTISGLYTPGSIIKPIVALGALSENVIDQNKKILSTGSISIPNPYDKTKETIFKDWRGNGWTKMGGAIALSSYV